jgi:hypothetical protein
LTVRKGHLHEENNRFLLPPVLLLFFEISRPANSKICAWGMSNQQIPCSGLCVCVCISGSECTVPVYERENIALDMPFRVSPGAWENISGKRSVTTIPECFTYRLRFFASN